MSLIPAIFGMDDYYAPYKKHARRLRPSDVGKKVTKVVAATTYSGGPDCSYTGEVFTVESIEMGHFTCFNCHKECDLLCGKCKHVSFCSKICQTKAWKLWHSATCDPSKVSEPRERPIKSVVLIDYKGQKKVLDTVENSWHSNYLYGWVVCDEVAQIKPDTTISDSHIQQLKMFESS
jgi:hypothetical protein